MHNIASMGSVHDTLKAEGRQGALALFERPEVEAASAYLSDECIRIGFLHSAWCQAALPHRRLKDDAVWRIDTDHVMMQVEPGRSTGRDTRHIGVPYGSRARLIMIYLQSEALRTKSREVQLGKSMRNWLGRMGVPIGGKSVRAISDQAERISSCRLTFSFNVGQGVAVDRCNIVDGALFLEPGADGPFLEVANLSDRFFSDLLRHPVPLEDAAVRAINNNSMALDLYAWLAYRLHILKGRTPISWSGLHMQFGNGIKEIYHFKPLFLANLRLALAVYPDAKVEVSDRGVDLHPSRPPVQPRISVG